MDYEKKYNEMVRRAKELHESGNALTRQQMEIVCPELTESEDERMIKAILSAIRGGLDTEKFLEKHGTNYEEVEAYLEKQKEQKPEFHPGDVVKCTLTGSLWVRCKAGDNRRSDGHTACFGGGFKLASKEEAVQFFQELTKNGYHWDCIKGMPIKEEQNPKLPKPHKGNDTNPYDMSVSEAQEYAIKRGFGIPYNDGEVYIDEKYMTQTIGNILRWADEHPKEQKPDTRDADDLQLLGFIYDLLNEIKWKDSWAMSKEECLRRLNDYRPQKPAEWSEQYIADIFEKVGLAKIVREQGNDDLTNALQNAMLELSKVGNTEWSEEEAKKAAEDYGYEHPGMMFENDGSTIEDYDKPCYDFMAGVLWAKHQCQPKVEWSKEDENKLNHILEIVHIASGSEASVDEKEELESFLKSLRPSWKPTEEQLEALNTLLCTGDFSYVGQATKLQELYIELNKRYKKQ